MMEKFVLVEKKKSVLMKAIQAIIILLAMAMVLLTILLWSSVYFTLACVLIMATALVTKRCVEFEYSYFDGEIRMTKIMNKSRRRAIAIYNMDETVTIAPSGDRSVYNYENDSSIKVRNLTSGNPGAKVYTMVTKGEKGMELIKFEPDEDILDEICKKYAQKVKR